ncbi:MAG: flagellar basal body L-ring protein FlgH [Phycisphaerae bacterium]
MKAVCFQKSVLAAVLAAVPASWAVGQSSSLFLKAQVRKAAAVSASTHPAANGALPANAGAVVQRPDAANPRLTSVSLTSFAPPEPAVIKVNDLIGVIIRERMRYESTSTAKQKSEWDLEAKLDAFFRIHKGNLIRQPFRGGIPEVKFKNTNDLKNKGDFDREDIFETRIMAKVIDVKPNGNLILMARARIRVEDEYKFISMTGECNKVDISADRTITSDKVFDPHLTVKASGTVTDGTRRGWLKKLTDKFKPF